MKNNIDSLFGSSTLKQVPLFYRFFTELETEQVGELRMTSRFSSSERHYSKSYMNMPFHKPISNVDPDLLFEKNG